MSDTSDIQSAKDLSMDVARVDIGDVVEEWAWDRFQRKASTDEKKLVERDQIRMEIDWKRVRFVHKTLVFDSETPASGPEVPLTNTLFETTFANHTDSTQKYTFRTQRSTRSTCTIQLNRAYTKSSNMELTLATPGGFMGTKAGFSRELQLTRAESQTIEQELQWAVDSQVEVKSKHRCHAKLVITEEEYPCSFSVKTRMRGRVRAVFTNTQDNNSFIRAAEGDINEIVKLVTAEGKANANLLTVDSSTKCVTFVTSGTCLFRYGLRQDVEVKQELIDS